MSVKGAAAATALRPRASAFHDSCSAGVSARQATKDAARDPPRQTCFWNMCMPVNRLPSGRGLAQAGRPRRDTFGRLRLRFSRSTVDRRASQACFAAMVAIPWGACLVHALNLAKSPSINVEVATARANSVVRKSRRPQVRLPHARPASQILRLPRKTAKLRRTPAV